MKINIETKYDVGDYVYTERDHKIVRLYIEKVRTSFPIDNDILISYQLSGEGTFVPMEEVTEERLDSFFRRNPKEAAKMIADNYLERFKCSKLD